MDGWVLSLLPSRAQAGDEEPKKLRGAKAVPSEEVPRGFPISGRGKESKWARRSYSQGAADLIQLDFFFPWRRSSVPSLKGRRAGGGLLGAAGEAALQIEGRQSSLHCCHQLRPLGAAGAPAGRANPSPAGKRCGWAPLTGKVLFPWEKQKTTCHVPCCAGRRLSGGNKKLRSPIRALAARAGRD